MKGTFSCIAQSATTPPDALLVSFELAIEIRKPHHSLMCYTLFIYDLHTAPPPNHCENNPCQNDGTCENLSDNFLCHCTARFTGPTCTSRKQTSIFMLQRCIIINQFFSCQD